MMAIIPIPSQPLKTTVIIKLVKNIKKYLVIWKPPNAFYFHRSADLSRLL